MGTVIERIDLARGGWRSRHSALHLAVAAARTCLQQARRDADDVDLLINAGIYRDRNLAEPALAALIQQDVGANPENPHSEGHGTFSFDVANGACGVLTALQIVDGFLRSRTIACALVVASDADPGRRHRESFPFAPAGAALLCKWTDDVGGLGPVSWLNTTDGGETFCATVGLEDSRNVLRFQVSAGLDEHFATAGAEAAGRCLEASGVALSAVDVIVAAPARAGFRAALAAKLGTAAERITVADDERTHTAALPTALHRVSDEIPPGGRILLVAVGAGITAGAALYRKPLPAT
ncbi:3-oxoacyl-ACP synthase III family protein [Mycolicibacterium gilvum]|uniref:3-oxoacyl-ACP synthase n=1 Tax=Mycolicibacterium gilvum TaxID=1804 RepID=A0A378SS31_9MYCO|nr:3-oxoacyl-[acyl-carrier-protein] synthase III C-terminal domain-containing protein [Mycolicibacterium gilvum]MCV7057840.1 3-oxoacyl-ACP synthase [Mycolicibacterium gilvum]STZ44674.1 3-oxoacyl-ACP synthase [Mycolicibacterium gilvum]